MEDLVKQRNSVKSQLAILLTKVNKHDVTPLDIFEVTISCDKLKSISELNDSIHSKVILLAADDAEAQLQEEIYEKIEDKVNSINYKLMKIKEEIKVEKSATAATVPKVYHHARVKLPVMELPKFDGNFENWTSFQDLFLTTINNDHSLSNAQKLQYLKSSLQGEAANLVKSFMITDINYGMAWSMLSDRYNNQREIVNSILKRLFNQPYLTKESQAGLQTLLDTTNECIRALTVHSRPVDTWDDILIYLVTERMDAESKRRWAMSLQGTDIPAFDKLTEFLEGHIRGLAASKSAISRSSSGGGGGQQQQVSTHHTFTAAKCVVCKGDHPLFRCTQFTSSTIEVRSKLIKSNNLCFNCLRAGHSVSSCRSESTCKTCNRKHNTLLHQDSKKSAAPAAEETPSTKKSNFTKPTRNSTQTLLATALVKVVNPLGVERVCRALLDNGSEVSFISDKMVRFLKLQKRKCNIELQGLQSTPVGRVDNQAEVKIQSCKNQDYVILDALIVPDISSTLPKYSLTTKSWSHLESLDLADPHFTKSSSVDILLGADVYAEIMRDGRRTGPKNTPIGQNSIFGWIVSGRVATSDQTTITVNHTTATDSTKEKLDQTDSILRRFWEIEEAPAIRHFTPIEQKAEDHFKTTHSRNQNGKYVVKLPFNSTINELGESRNSAVRRWKHVERRLAQQPLRHKQYHEFMREYLSLGHMEQIPKADINKSPGNVYYLPHHFVLKSEKDDLKFRVVFDGGAKSTTGISLNDCLLTGPTVQDDLFSLLLRFRINPVALKADIKKMYRQFEVHPDDADYQRIVYREHPDEPLKDYRLLTITYGTASAPFLATRCLEQLAIDEGSNFPLASSVIQKDFYVDDLMGGATNAEEGIRLQQQLTELTAKGAMELCKWSSNSQEVLNTIPAHLQEIPGPQKIDTDESIKALGVQWNPVSDTFSFSVVTPTFPAKLTKRIMLSQLAKVFDPQGLLAPATIRAKVMFQSLWKLKDLEWDHEVPESIGEQWKLYQEDLSNIKEIFVPRCLVRGKVVSKTLHGFSDASMKAYSACVYLKSISDDGAVDINLVTAKTRVAPEKIISLAKLELCGAVLLANLMNHVDKHFNTNTNLIAWTDSTVVLDWLSSSPSRWKTFVANRVSEIQDLIPRENWHHISGEINPADCASRGITANQLKTFDLWWHGPEFLQKEDFPIFTQLCSKTLVEEEEKKRVVAIHHVCLKEDLISKYSNLLSLQRVTAYCLRFIRNIKQKDERTFGPLSPNELQNSLQHWIIHDQQQSFSKEISSMTSNKPIHQSSVLKSLNPFLDNQGVLRVGGRLQHANIPESQKHPIVLSSSTRLTRMIVEYHHKKNLHAGIQLLQAILNQTFWIIRAKDVIKRITRQCIICRRYRAIAASQLMGSLPSPRVTPSRPFLQCGVDYAGPFDICDSKGRGRKTLKYYISLFVCLATKAIHLELVSDLSTEAFIAAYKRFTSRRGICSDLYSDCGTNFVGANRELQALLESTQHQSLVSHQMADNGTQWHFNPPAAPHQGGLWEAGVKSVKYHLRRVVGASRLTCEDFSTILCQIEACLNSRPLCAMSSDPSDLTVLTPGHFLIGEPLNAIPNPDLTNLKVNTLSRWQFTQQLFQHFWKRWSAEYLTSLQQRFKWTAKRDNYQVDDLVIIRDELQPPMKWKIGRIIEVFVGDDKCVRVVNLKTSTGELKRPVVKLCPLITHNDNFD